MAGPGLAAIVALAVVGLAFNDGSYAVTTRNAIAAVVWAALLVGVLAGALPRSRPSRTAAVAAGALLGLALLALLSIAWSDSAERPFDEAMRLVLYLGVLLLVVSVARPGTAGRWVDGLALGIAAIAVLALVARLFPSFIDAAKPAAAFEGDVRPTYPLGYWNGVAVFAALGLPLLLRAGLRWSRPWARGAGIALAPPLVAVIYLTSSRTGVVTALVAVLGFLALTTDRGRAAVAATVAGVGGAVAVAVLGANSAILDGPLSSSAAHREGRICAAVILAVSVATGVAHVLSARWHLEIPRPSPRTKKIALAVAGLLALAAVVAADPAERFESFKEPPPPREATVEGSYIKTHLTSGGSSGRWQFWTAAIDEWEEHPLVGDGAGSYGAWWARNGSLSYVTRDAHSLYAETLGELGLLGFVLLLALLGAVAVAASRRLRVRDDDRTTVAAAAAVAAGFAVGTGIDWTWELPGVALVGIVAFGVLVGPAAEPASPADDHSRPWPWAPRVAVAVLAVAAIVAQAIPLLAQRKLSDSRDKFDDGDLPAALDAARDARSWQPWAASPHYQVAVVEGTAKRFDEAREAIDEAIERDETDWRLRLVASRLEAAAGDEQAAEREFGEALALNPRSPLLKSIQRKSRRAREDG